jgi:hypothetical protein
VRSGRFERGWSLPDKFGFDPIDDIVVLVYAAENEVELNMAAKTFRMQ